MWNVFFRSIIIGYLGYVIIVFKGFIKAQKNYFPFKDESVIDEDKTNFLGVLQTIIMLVFCLWFRRLTYNVIWNNREKL